MASQAREFADKRLPVLKTLEIALNQVVTWGCRVHGSPFTVGYFVPFIPPVRLSTALFTLQIDN